MAASPLADCVLPSNMYLSASQDLLEPESHAFGHFGERVTERGTPACSRPDTGPRPWGRGGLVVVAVRQGWLKSEHMSVPKGPLLLN